MSSRNIILLFLLLELLVVVLAGFSDGFTLVGLQTMIRYSGWLSLMLFSFIFLQHQHPQIIQQWLSAEYLLLFAIVQGIHLLELFLYTWLAKPVLNPYRLVGGGLSYVFIFSMPVIFNRFRRGEISSNSFTRIETVFVYFIWLVYFMTYLPEVQGRVNVTGGSYGERVASLGWVSILMGYKLSSLMRRNNSRGE